MFKPSSELKKYIENARQRETNLLEKQKCAIAQLCAAMGNGGKTPTQWKMMIVANAIQYT
jgi:hypothetical protein